MHSSRLRTGRTLTVFWGEGGIPKESRNQKKNWRPPEKLETPRDRTTPSKKLETPPKNWRPPEKLETPPGPDPPPPWDWLARHARHYRKHTPPVNRMTNRCKNITLAKTSFRPVTIYRRTWLSKSMVILVSRGSAWIFSFIRSTF